MADNVTLPGSGSVVATDDVSGNHYQKVKLDLGSDGSSSPVSAGPQVSSVSVPVVGPTDEFVTVSVDVTRPADTTVYAVNDCISDSTSAAVAFTIPNAVKAAGGSGIITDVVMATSADPATPVQLEIFLLDSSVTSPNDNAAFTLSDTDAKKIVGLVPIVAQDIGNNHFCHAQNLSIGFTCTGTADLRFLLRVKNAYGPASGEVFTFRFKIQRMT